jgi:hypothetical protein
VTAIVVLVFVEEVISMKKILWPVTAFDQDR